MGKLRNFSEGKIKIHKDEPVIAFKFTGKEPMWAVKKEAGKKVKIIKALEAKLKPLIEEHQALKADIATAKKEFWKGFLDMFDPESIKQLEKFDHEVSEADLEIYCVKPENNLSEAIDEMAKRAVSGEFGEVGEPVGGFMLKKNSTEAEMRVAVREQLAKILPKELLTDLDRIVDEMVSNIRSGKQEGAGGFSINVNTGKVERIV